MTVLGRQVSCLQTSTPSVSTPIAIPPLHTSPLTLPFPTHSLPPHLSSLDNHDSNPSAAASGGGRRYQCFPVGAYAVFDEIPAGFQSKIMPKINEFNAAAAGGEGGAFRRTSRLYPPVQHSDIPVPFHSCFILLFDQLFFPSFPLSFFLPTEGAASLTATESEHLDRLISVLVATSHYHSSSIAPAQIGVGEKSTTSPQFNSPLTHLSSPHL